MADQVTSSQEGIGCRGVALTTLAFVALASAMWTIGWMVGAPDTCTAVCEWSSFTLLFAAGPVSALFTVLGGSDLVLGWPLDVLVWLLLASLHQKLSSEATPWSRTWARWYGGFVAIALLYGGMMALLVSRVR